MGMFWLIIIQEVFMATLAQIHNARVSSDLVTKVESAILVASRDIRAEDVATASHATRIAMANKCFTNDVYLQQIVSAMMFYVGTNDTIAANLSGATDNDIQFVVNSIYTDISIVFPPA
jgi:hypothetical protein